MVSAMCAYLAVAMVSEIVSFTKFLKNFVLDVCPCIFCFMFVSRLILQISQNDLYAE